MSQAGDADVHIEQPAPLGNDDTESAPDSGNEDNSPSDLEELEDDGAEPQQEQEQEPPQAQAQPQEHAYGEEQLIEEFQRLLSQVGRQHEVSVRSLTERLRARDAEIAALRGRVQQLEGQVAELERTAQEENQTHTEIQTEKDAQIEQLSLQVSGLLRFKGEVLEAVSRSGTGHARLPSPQHQTRSLGALPFSLPFEESPPHLNGSTATNNSSNELPHPHPHHHLLHHTFDRTPPISSSLIASTTAGGSIVSPPTSPIPQLLLPHGNDHHAFFDAVESSLARDSSRSLPLMGSSARFPAVPAAYAPRTTTTTRLPNGAVDADLSGFHDLEFSHVSHESVAIDALTPLRHRAPISDSVSKSLSRSFTAADMHRQQQPLHSSVQLNSSFSTPSPSLLHHHRHAYTSPPLPTYSSTISSSSSSSSAPQPSSASFMGSFEREKAFFDEARRCLKDDQYAVLLVVVKELTTQQLLQPDGGDERTAALEKLRRVLGQQNDHLYAWFTKLLGKSAV